MLDCQARLTPLVAHTAVLLGGDGRLVQDDGLVGGGSGGGSSLLLGGVILIHDECSSGTSRQLDDEIDECDNGSRWASCKCKCVVVLWYALEVLGVCATSRWSITCINSEKREIELKRWINELQVATSLL